MPEPGSTLQTTEPDPYHAKRSTLMESFHIRPPRRLALDALRQERLVLQMYPLTIAMPTCEW